MNQIYDPLEAELREFVPHEVSPALKQRIGQRLAESANARSRPPWGVVLASALAAACLAAILLGWRGNGGVEPSTASPPAGNFIEFEDIKPTLLAYRHALSRSPQELDALLDRHAVLTLPPDPRGLRTQAFVRSDIELHPWIGEL